MPMLDDSGPVSVEAAPSPGARNDIANLPCITELAQILIECNEVLLSIAGFVAEMSRIDGYDGFEIVNASRKVGLRSPGSVAARTAKALQQISAEYRSRLPVQCTRETREDLAGRFTSGISEAMVLLLLSGSGKRLTDITRDAHVFRSGRKLNSKNIDFVWGDSHEKAAGIYECKNQPNKLLHEFYARDKLGDEAKWPKTKTWLLLELRRLLEDECGWDVQLALISLRSRQRHKQHLELPTRIQLYYVEDIPNFPNRPPETVG